MVVGALRGLEHLVSFVCSQIGAFPYHLGEFFQILGEEKEFMVQAAIVFKVSDSVFKGPRVLLQVRLHLESCSQRASVGCLWKTV